MHCKSGIGIINDQELQQSFLIMYNVYYYGYIKLNINQKQILKSAIGCQSNKEAHLNHAFYLE